MRTETCAVRDGTFHCPDKGSRVLIKPTVRVVPLAGAALKVEVVAPVSGGLAPVEGALTHRYALSRTKADQDSRDFYAFEMHVHIEGAGSDLVVTLPWTLEALAAIYVVTETPDHVVGPDATET